MSSTNGNPSNAVPLSQTERIIILDSLRGLAVLGILLMNIPGFGLPHLLVFDISVLKETGLNFFTWMLFWAGTIVFNSRLEKRMTGLLPC